MSNVEVRYSIYFIKAIEQSDSTLHHSKFLVRYSAVRCLIFWSFIRGFSAAAGLKSGQFNQKKNLWTSNIQHPITPWRDRIRYFVYLKKDLAKRFHPSIFDIRYSIFCGSAVRFLTSCSFIWGFRGSGLNCESRWRRDQEYLNIEHRTSNIDDATLFLF